MMKCCDKRTGMTIIRIDFAKQFSSRFIKPFFGFYDA